MTVSLRDATGEVELAVEDAGPGIPPAREKDADGVVAEMCAARLADQAKV